MANLIKKIFEWLYYLTDNALTEKEGDKIAKVKRRKTRNMNDVANRIVKERTEFRAETILNIAKMINDTKKEFLSQGDSVNDGLFIFEPSITGAFVKNDFEPSIHSCIINTRCTKEMNDMLAQTTGVYSGHTVENGGASIDEIVDLITGLNTGEVTSGKVVTLSGNKIRIIPEEGENPEDCVYITSHATEQVFSPSDPLITNDPSKLVLTLPELVAGYYTLSIKTLFSSRGTNLNSPRHVTFKTKLTVI